MCKAEPGAPQETKEALSQSASEKLSGEMKEKPYVAIETPIFPRGCVLGLPEQSITN